MTTTAASARSRGAPPFTADRWPAVPAVGRLAALLLCLVPLAACDDFRFPRDPDRTLQTVLLTGEMTVAAVDHVPWVIVDDDGAPRGAEVELVQAFARELGVAVEWRRMPASDALEGLESGDIDLAIGGLERRAVAPTPGVAPSYTYFREARVIGVRPGAPFPAELDEFGGAPVFVPPDVPVAQLIRNNGGVPVSEMAVDVTLAAVPHWQLEPRGLLPTGLVLQRIDHVVVVRQGENAWLMRIERFLRGQTGDMGARLADHLQ